MSAASKRFDDPAYVEDFKTFGIYPAIHRDISLVIDQWASEREPSLDLGACTGLLSYRLATIRQAPVLAIEARLKSISQAIAHPLIRYECMTVEPDTLLCLADMLHKVKPTLVVARRVLPEIAGETNVDLVSQLGSMFYAFGVRKVLIEGRIPTPLAKSPLSDFNKEAAALSRNFTPTRYYKNCVLLVRKAAH